MAEETTVEGAAGAQASSDGGAEPSRAAESDFLERARRDPDWAAEQLRRFQSKADRLQSAEDKYQELVSKLGSAKDFIDQYGGDTVAQAVSNYAALRTSEQIGEVVQAFERTGKLPTRTGSEPKDDMDDEYLTEDEKKYKALEAELQEIKQRQSMQVFSSGKEAIKRHIERVASEYDFEDSDFDKMKQRVHDQITAWARAGDVGERALEALASENGMDQVKGLMLQSVTPDVLLRAAQRADLRKQGKLKTLATERPGRISSDGKEPPPKFKDWAEAALWAENNPDAHDSY